MPVFMNLPRDGGRLTDLAEVCDMTKQSMGYLVEDLEHLGYLRRDQDHRDGRVRMITRTRRGWRVNETARRAVASVEEDWSRLLGGHRIPEFKDSLNDIAHHLGAGYAGSVSAASSRHICSRPQAARTTDRGARG